MDLLEVLSTPGVGNFLLLLASIIGVAGSYTIYKIRIRDRKAAARRAIKSELESMTVLSVWVESAPGIPKQPILPSSAYESHLTDIGLLTDEEAERITGFYSNVEGLESMIEINREIQVESGLQTNVRDRGRSTREKKIADQLDRLAVRRWQLLQIIRRELGEEYERPEKLDFPNEAGEKIPKKHPFIDSHGNRLVSRGYFEDDPDSNCLVLTEEGEEWFATGVRDDMGF